jgi:hypothetical protein
MTKIKVLFVSLLLVFGLGVTVPGALAQETMTATTQSYTLRPNSNADAFSPITLSIPAGGIIDVGEVFTVTYSLPIVGADKIGTASAPAGDFCISTNAFCANVTVSALGRTLTLAYTGAAGLDMGVDDTIEIYGVRVMTYGFAGTSITGQVLASRTTPDTITFENGTNVVTTVVGSVSSISTVLVTPLPSASTYPFTEETCFAIPNVTTPATITMTIAENWPGAWTSKADEKALAPYLATNGSDISVVVTGIPAGVTVTPAAPVDFAGSAVWGSFTPTSYTGKVANDTVTFDFPLTSTISSEAESATFVFTVTSTGPIATNSPDMYIGVQLNPLSSVSGAYPAFTYPSLSLPDEKGTPIDAITFVDCTTQLLFPYVTNYNGGAALGALGNWDTAIEVANASTIPSSFPISTPPQNGTCTFYFYNAGTAPTYTAPSAAATAIPPYITPFILSGGNYSFMLSSVAPGLSGGYAWANCGFLYGAGYAELVDNANGLGNWQVMAGYLADPKKK